MSQVPIAQNDGYGVGRIPHVALPSQVQYGIPPPQQQFVQASDVHHTNDVIILNVGGTIFHTLYDTLANKDSGFFSQRFRVDRNTGRVVAFQQQIIYDSEGRVFINRDGRLFNYVLQYLRDTVKTVLPDDISLLKQLAREAEFYAIDRFGKMIREKIAYEEQQQNNRDDNLDEICATVQKIHQQLYVTNFRK